MVYLKLAYLAEFAVVFNLAFGEFKQERIAKELEDRFTKLDLECDTSLSDLAFAAKSSQIETHKTPLMDVQQSWLSKSICRFEYLRVSRKIKPNPPSNNPLRKFVSRVLLFATNPSRCNGRKLPLTSVPMDVIFGLHRGLLASWTYSKTKNWEHPPCKQSIQLWSLIIIAGLILLVFPEELIAAAGYITSFQPNTMNDAMPYIFVLIGVATGFLCLRPISAFSALLIGRYPPTPRGRYYSIVMVALVSIIIASLTFCEVFELQLNNFVVLKVSLFLFGFLISATALPLLLFTGHLVLETAITDWTLWAEDAAKDAASVAITKLV
jgi:hypothetical protein